MRRLVDDVDFDALERRRRNADDQEMVTAGRAAQMLRMTDRAVRYYAEAGEVHGRHHGLVGVRLEGPRRGATARTRQVVFTKAEVRRFRELLEDRRRRSAPHRKQLALPLVAPPPAIARRPEPWGAFRPVMLKLGRQKTSGSGSRPVEIRREKTRVA
jgi:hypothetical protein